MESTNGRGKSESRYGQNCQRNTENVLSRLGGSQRQGFSARNDSYPVLYSDREGRDKAGTWATPRGQATPGGIHRRLKKLHKAWLQLIESQQRQLEVSLQESKNLTAEMQILQSLLAETLDDIPEE